MRQRNEKGQFEVTHGMSHSRIYSIWDKMIWRCENPKATKFHLYGGRGIKVCKRWHTFENFLADMGEPPTGTSLDRKDSNGNYEPKNCRWATLREQALNRRPGLNGNALTQNQVRVIRKLISQGIKDRVIGEKFKVSQAAISKIRRGISWGKFEPKITRIAG